MPARQLNVDRLDDERGDDNCFFAFADTVVARSYRGGREVLQPSKAGLIKRRAFFGYTKPGRD